MGKLIDLDAVLDILHLDPGIATEQERMIKELREAVIRCKDCRYAKITIDGKYCKYCTFLMDNFDICDAIYFEADYFCGSGERRTDDRSKADM